MRDLSDHLLLMRYLDVDLLRRRRISCYAQKMGEIVSGAAPTGAGSVGKMARVKAAVRKNVEFLIREGFLPRRGEDEGGEV